MFKQSVIIIFLIFLTLLIIFIFYHLIRNIFITTHKLYLNKDIIKYKMHESDRDYLNKYSIKTNISEFKKGIFYTNTPWKSNSAYFKFKDRYYIIEPDYYYYINEDTEIFKDTDIKIYTLKIK